MWRFIVVTFAFLGFAFYELSGGSDFEPRKRPVELAEAPSVAPEPVVVPKVEEKPVEEVALAALDSALTDGQKTLVDAGVAVQPDEVIASPLDVRLQLEIPAVTMFQPVTQPSADAEEVASVSPLLEALEAEEETGPDMRTVSGLRVNMRNGPGTRYNIIARLASGDEVEVLEDPGNGWLKLRALEDGRVGWMSAKLVSAPN